MKINIMGASGQLGRKIVFALLDRGYRAADLIASVRTPSRAQDLAERGVEIRTADYDDLESMRAAFHGTDCLHLIPSLAPVEARIAQHGRAIEAACAAGVRRTVFSSLTTAGFPDSRFVITPFMVYAEMKLRQSGMGWTILRNGMYLDPIADWLPELKEMGRVPYPVRDGRVAYVSRADLARATAGALLDDAHSGKLFELTGPDALTMDRLAEAVSQATNSAVRFDHVRDDEYARICREGKEEVSERMIHILTTLYHAVDNREFARVTNHVELLSGRVPETVQSFLSRAGRQRV